MAEKTKIYLKNKDLFNEIIVCKEKGELTKEAWLMLILLTKRVSTKMRYVDPEDRKDCIGFAHLDILKYWNNFNPEISQNAFSFYTQMIKNGLGKGWNHIRPKKYAGTLSYDRNLKEDSDGIYSII